MKRFLLFLFVVSGLVAKAQTTDPLHIEGLAVSPEVTAAKSYYLKNVGTGLYMSYGGEWGTHCIETNAAHPIALETNGEYVAIGSLLGYLESNTLWMDFRKETSKWRLEKAEGYTNQYYLVGDGDRVLTSIGNSAGLLVLEKKATAPAKAYQRWVFLDDADINKKMYDATAENPLDVTPFIKAATFDKADGRGTSAYDANAGNPNKEYPGVWGTEPMYNDNWTNYVVNSQSIWDCGFNSWDANEYNWIGVINGPDGTLDVTQSVQLKAGTYYFSFEGFCNRYNKKVEQYQKKYTGESDYSNDGDPVITETPGMDMNASVTVNGKEYPLTNAKFATLAEADNFADIAIAMRDADTYKQEDVFYLASDATVEFKISKKDSGTGDPYDRDAPTGKLNFSFSGSYYDRTVTETYNYPRIYIDEFVLQYYGPEQLATVDQSNIYVPYIEANIAEYKEFFNETGDAALDEFMASIDLNEVDTKEEYYNAIATLNAAYAYAQLKHDEQSVADLSGVIINHSFEMGNLTGWTVVNKEGDTEVRQGNAGGTYGTAGIDGTYLYNTWRINHDTPGCKIGQVVKALPKGKYTLEVLVATDKDRSVTITGNGVSTTHTIVGDGATFEEAEVTFNVGSDGLAEISAEGSGWYKVDNFRLVYLGNEVNLSQENTVLNYEDKDFATLVTIDRTMPNSNWSTLVVPFNMAIPEGWTVKQLTDDTYISGSVLCLRFEDATSIEAGVPYLVRHTQGESVTLPEVKDVTLTTTLLPSCVSGCVDFCGTYTTGVIPAGAFYLSGNKFYKATTDIPTKGFRAYFMPKSSEVKSLGFDSDDVDFTGIEGVESNAAETVAIYGADGTLRSDLQKGINIVKMSDGTTKKVLVP